MGELPIIVAPLSEVMVSIHTVLATRDLNKDFPHPEVVAENT